MTPPPSSSPGELERLVQFCHPAKILGTTRLPGRLDDRSLARLYASSVEEHRALAADFRARAANAARELLDDDELRQAAGAMPRGTLLAVGDSITDDAQSWAEIVRHVLHVMRPDGGTQIVNAGLSGDTTTTAIARVQRLAAARPDVVLVLLGTNDARRHGRNGAPMLVSHAETARNLRCLQRGLAAVAPSVGWIVPPPVLEDRIATDPLLLDAGLTWRAADVKAKAGLVRRIPGAAVDAWAAFGSPPPGDLLLPDGLHPSLKGQMRIAAAVLRAFADRHRAS